jgi:hypothetical protein
VGDRFWLATPTIWQEKTGPPQILCANRILGFFFENRNLNIFCEMRNRGAELGEQGPAIKIQRKKLPLYNQD